MFAELRRRRGVGPKGRPLEVAADHEPQFSLSITMVLHCTDVFVIINIHVIFLCR